jgi:hypothetical protein
MSDDAADAPADTAPTMCLWMIVLTTVLLIASILTVNSILADHYPADRWF